MSADGKRKVSSLVPPSSSESHPPPLSAPTARKSFGEGHVGHAANSSAPSLLERSDSSPFDERDASRASSFPELKEGILAPTLASESASGYFTHRPHLHSQTHDARPSFASVASPHASKIVSPPSASRDWSFGSAWSWANEPRISTSARFVVPAASGHASAAPLFSMSRCPDDANRVVVAGRFALRILQISATYGASPSDRGHAVIEQIEDVRDASRLGKAYSLTDVKWGYAATSRKLATGSPNGCVVLWDLEMSRRVAQTKSEHERAVNRVLFAGGSGIWLMSAAQDGHCKVWDVRTPAAAHTALVTSTDPARDVVCHPITSAPHYYSVCTLHESGALHRWDLRRTNQPMDRLQAHAGGGLSMAWKEASFDPAIESQEMGVSYLATSGMDKTVKIWRMASNGLPVRPLHTLNPPSPVVRLAWRPGRPSEIATIALPQLGAGEMATREQIVETPLPYQTSSQVDIWDLRRPYVPKHVLHRPQEGAPASVLFADEMTVWTIHKTTAAFVQHDVEREAVRPDRMLPTAALGWATFGELAFATQGRTEESGDGHATPAADIDAPTLEVDQPLATVALPEFDLDAATFRHLAENYVFSGMPFEQMCLRNADVAEEADRVDAVSLWRICRLCFGNTALDTRDTTENFGALTPHRNPLLESVQNASSLTSGTSPRRIKLEARKLSLVPESNDSDLENDTEASRLTKTARGNSQAPSETAEMSSSPESDRYFATVVQPPQLDSDSSASDAELDEDISRRSTSLPPTRTYEAQSRSSSKSSGLATPRVSRPGFLSPAVQPVHPPKAPSPISSGSESSDAEGPYGSAQTASRLLKEQRRALSEARVPQSQIKPRTSRSRTRRVAGRQLKHTASALAALPTRGSIAAHAAVAKQQEKEAKELEREWRRPEPDWIGLKRELAQRLDASLREALDMSAEQGDAQICVTVMFVMRDFVTFDTAFRMRATATYIDLLRRFDLHAVAAAVQAASPDGFFRQKSVDSTTIYTACGRCRKSLADPPYGTCRRCRQPAVRCTICHRSRRQSVLGFCSTCGHAVHRECIAAYLQPGGGSHPLSDSRSSLTTTPALSGPSTPKFYFGDWLFGADEGGHSDSHPDSYGGSTPSPRLSHAGLHGDTLFSCPSGCECSPCALYACFDVLPFVHP